MEDTCKMNEVDKNNCMTRSACAPSKGWTTDFNRNVLAGSWIEYGMNKWGICLDGI